MGSALVYRERDHSYFLGGQKVPSVTTATGVLAKPALIWWAAKEAASWAADNSEQLATVGREGFVDEATRAHIRARDTASKIGTQLHLHAEKLASTGEAPDVAADDLAMVVQAADFLDALSVDPIVSERAVYHETFLYAGRLDLIAAIRGEVWLLDFKTGASGVWPEMALQQAGYRFATHMQGPDPDAPDEPMPPIAHVGIVWVRPDGWQLVPVRADRDTWQAFLACLPLQRFLTQKRDQTVGAPVAVGTATERLDDDG